MSGIDDDNSEDAAKPEPKPKAKPKPRQRQTARIEDQSTGDPTVLERSIGLFIGVIIIGIALYLVITNHKFEDKNTALIMRLVLSVGMGAVGATVPGFLRVDYKKKGLVIRTAGGMAVFFITLAFSPKVYDLEGQVKPAKIVVDQPKLIDLRSSSGGMTNPKDLYSGVVMATVALTFDNLHQPAKTGVVESTDLYFTLEGKGYQMRWRSFVNLQNEQDKSFLEIIKSAENIVVPAGDSKTIEIMHGGVNYRWFDFMKDWRKVSEDRLKFSVVSKVRDFGDVAAVCTVDRAKWVKKIDEEARASNGNVPLGFTMCCLERDPKTAAPFCNEG